MAIEVKGNEIKPVTRNASFSFVVFIALKTREIGRKRSLVCVKRGLMFVGRVCLAPLQFSPNPKLIFMAL